MLYFHGNGNVNSMAGEGQKKKNNIFRHSVQISITGVACVVAATLRIEILFTEYLLT